MKIILVMIFYSFSLFGEISPFVLITVPKSGSHLAIKALYLLTKGGPIWHTYFPSFWTIPPEHGFLYTHFCLTPQLEADYAALPQLKKIVMIRDLRDVAVSIVYQILKAPWPGMTAKIRKTFQELPFDEQLLFVINYEYDVYKVVDRAPNSNQVSLTHIAEQVVRYCNDPSNLVCKYEDLVGPMAGGNYAAQIETLQRMEMFLGTRADLFDIAEKLYGDEYNPFENKKLGRNFRSTFRNGKIGSWREVFKDEHKQAFKLKLGYALIALGYEQDLNW